MGKATVRGVGICQGPRNSCREGYLWAAEPPWRGLLAFGFADETFEPGHVGDSEVVALAPQQTG
jgi:hypothetical protein